MPLYDYKCDSCGNKEEVLKKHSDPDPRCPKCGSDEFKREVSSASFELKGNGWYATDFKNKR
jgi:putative FmdB family regulatory protein